DEFINRKVKAALQAGLQVIVCIGETLEERQAGQVEAVFTRQIGGSLAGITPPPMGKGGLGYGTGGGLGTRDIAPPEQAQTAHRWIREHVAKLWDRKTAETLTIQYGGSAKPDNVKTLLSQPDVDGALVGGASLKADTFLAIIGLA